MPRKRTPPTWTALKKQLTKMPHEDLLALVGDLVKLDPHNRSFVEAGTNHAADYGAMDQGLCDSLVSMFRSVLKDLPKLSETDARPFWRRLEEVVARADGTGWWYHETLAEFLDVAVDQRY